MIKFSKEEKDKIIEKFNNNELMIMETDTVYGIMAKACVENEIKINKFKDSNIDKKISVIFPNKKTLYKYLYDISYYKKEYMDNRLPGKYTFIVKLRNFSDFSREDFGVRITGSSYLQEILEQVGPILASSCNKSGDTVINSIDDIVEKFGNSDIGIVNSDKILDTPSSIINLLDDIEVVR